MCLLFLQDSFARHPREGGDPGGLVTYSECVILDPRLREDDGVLFALKFVISNFFPRVFGFLTLRQAQGDASRSSKNVQTTFPPPIFISKFRKKFSFFCAIFFCMFCDFLGFGDSGNFKFSE